MLPEDVLQKYRKAGRIASNVRNMIPNLVHEGAFIIDICDKVESIICEHGGKPAFPCNVCINNIAAHYTSPPGDVSTIPGGSLVKVDIGVHVDGYIADTAVTICLNPEYSPLVEAVEIALNEACAVIRPGIKTSAVGTVIQRAIETRGFKPIWNLCGHKTVRYMLHAGKSVPNVSHLNREKIEADEVYAVEPFVVMKEAAGRVEELSEALIYRYVKDRPLKRDSAKLLLQRVKNEFRTLPFAKRWIQNLVPPLEFDNAFSELLSSKAIVKYPVLAEASGSLVAQAEHTVIVTQKGCMVITL